MSVSVMKKLTVLAPERMADPLVRRLMRLRCAEITQVPTGDDGELLRHNCDTERVEAEKRVSDVTGALAILDRYHTKPKPWNRRPIEVGADAFRKDGRYDKALEVVRRTLDADRRMTAAQNEVNRTNSMMKSMEPWRDYNEKLGDTATGLCDIWLGALPPGSTLGKLDEALAGCHAALERVSEDESAVYIAAIFLREEEDEVSRILTEQGFLRAAFKNLPGDGTAVENIRLGEARLRELENQLQGCSDELHELAESIEDVEVLSDMVNTSLTAATERAKLAETDLCVVLDAWIPAERENRVAAALNKMDCAYDMRDPDPETDEEPPVLLKNNGYASNFEWVVGMYSYPKYGTYDPTFIMSIFYFVIFGLMFADVGYGSILLLAGFLVPKILHMKGGMKRTLNMFGYCGISCTLLGVVFGGWFGDLPYAIMTGFMGYESAEAAQAAAPFFNGLSFMLNGTKVSLNPLVNPMGFLGISLAIGAIHLIAGMAVKFYVLCKQKDFVGAIFDIGSWWIIFAGIAVAAVVDMKIGLIMAGVGVLMIVAMAGRAQRNIFLRFFTGLKSLYDIVNYASDLLSYCRILALGLAASVIGQVVNLLATMGGPTVPGILLLIFVMVLGHTLNLAINLLGSFVHTSRLQYIEFFGKFFEDGGEPFAPALPADQYSTAETDPE